MKSKDPTAENTPVLDHLRDAMDEADGREKRLIEEVHKRIVDERASGVRHWICPCCQTISRASSRPSWCPECGENGHELAHVAIRDVSR